MKTYCHYRPSTVWLNLVALGILTLLFTVVLVMVVFTRPINGPPPLILLLFFVPIGISLWLFGWTATEIRTDDEGRAEFIAPFGRWSIPIADVVSISPSGFTRGLYFVLKHRNGTLRFDARLTGMHELITDFVRLNPGIELRGI
jgi:hypothetical protein